MPIRTLLILVLFSFSAAAQKKKERYRNEIFEAAIIYHYQNFSSKPGLVDVLINSNASPVELTHIDFSEIVDNIGNLDKLKNKYVGFDNLTLDPSWEEILRKADKDKRVAARKSLNFTPTLTGIGIITNNSDSQFHYTISVPGSSVKKFLAHDHGLLSDIIFLKGKAIVEFSYISHYDEGEGDGQIFFLQKIKNKWVVVSYIESWIS